MPFDRSSDNALLLHTKPTRRRCSGGISKAYQSATGIAGYTLIYDSHSLNLAEHKPFVEGEYGNTPTIHLVEKLEQRANIADTDRGKEINDRVNDLHQLLDAYKAGLIK